MAATAVAGIGIPSAVKAALTPFSAHSNDERHQVIIIGSGYGASVAALSLARKGIKVVILEMGMEWKTTEQHNTFCKLLNPDKRSAWLRTKSIAPFANVFHFQKYTGVLDRIEFEKMKIYVGRGVGGGSLVNGGMAVTPRRDYFEHILPRVNSEEMYRDYFPMANAQLKVNHIDPGFFEETEYYHFTRTARMQAEKAGYKTTFVPNVYDFKYMEQEAKGTVYQSALNGEVIYGNNAGKNSLDKTYLAEARNTGLVEVRSLHEVININATDSGYVLNVNNLDAAGAVVKKKIFTCKHLFVCAGSVGTSRMLLKAKATGTLPDLNEYIGRNWGNNGNVMTGRNFVKQGNGAKQSCIPVMAIDDWDNKEYPVFAEISPIPMKMETWTTLYLAITKNPNRGQFIYDANNDILKLKLTEDFTKGSVAATRNLVARLNKANGGTKAHLLFHNGIGDDICYHPLGGCVLGEASDLYGRVHGYQHLYAIDGSMIPGSTGVNPFVTITALAERCMARIIKEDFT